MHRAWISAFFSSSPAAATSLLTWARQYGSRNELAIIVAFQVPCGETSSPVGLHSAVALVEAEWQSAHALDSVK